MNTPATTRPALPATPASPEERLQAALRRLELNRAALRRELVPLPDAPAIGPDGRLSSLTDPLRRWWRRLRKATRHSPVAAVMGDAVQGWWQHHPWRATGTLLYAQVRPVLRRHPVAATAIAAFAGAAVVGLRPWRWQAVDEQLRPLPGRVLHWLMGQLNSAPMQTALVTLALMALRADEPPPSRTDAPDPATPGA